MGLAPGHLIRGLIRVGLEPGLSALSQGSLCMWESHDPKVNSP